LPLILGEVLLLKVEKVPPPGTPPALVSAMLVKVNCAHAGFGARAVMATSTPVLREYNEDGDENEKRVIFITLLS
jgi:hypothetical protein